MNAHLVDSALNFSGSTMPSCNLHGCIQGPLVWTMSPKCVWCRMALMLARFSASDSRQASHCCNRHNSNLEHWLRMLVFCHPCFVPIVPSSVDALSSGQTLAQTKFAPNLRSAITAGHGSRLDYRAPDRCFRSVCGAQLLACIKYISKDTKFCTYKTVYKKR